MTTLIAVSVVAAALIGGVILMFRNDRRQRDNMKNLGRID